MGAAGMTAFTRTMRAITIVVLAMAATLAGATQAGAATTVLRPTSDVLMQWGVTGATTGWDALDDALAQPQSVSAAEYVYACAAGRTLEVALPDRPLGGEVPQASRVWYYANAAAGASMIVEVVSGGVVRASATLTGTASFMWRSLDWQPGSQAEIDDARLRFRLSMSSGCSNVRAAYVELVTSAAPAADTTPPVTTIAAGPADTVRRGVARFSLSSTEAASTFQCRLDAGVWQACGAESTVHVAAGRHTFQARATDAAGNVDPNGAVRTWWADPLLPNGTFEADSAGWEEQNHPVAGWRSSAGTVAQVAGGAVGGRGRVTAIDATSFLSLYSSPRPINSSVAGAPYAASGLVRSETADTRLCLVITERSAAGVVGSAEGCTIATTAWQSFPTVRYTAAGSANEVLVSVEQRSLRRSGDSFEVDALELTDGGPERFVEPVATPPGDPVLLALADAAVCWSSGDEAVSRLLDTTPGLIAVAGDTEQQDGTAGGFKGCFDPVFGRHVARMRPAVGDHEYRTPLATPYWNYFGAAAGPREKGWYAYDLGAWHVVVLNSNCDQVGGCGPGSPQYEWLKADLAANARSCTAAYFHHPRWSAGTIHGSSTHVAPFWDLLYRFGAEFVFGGNDHTYQRFAPQSPDGRADPVHGVRQFIVGTGGAQTYPLGPPLVNTEVQATDVFGALRLTLRADRYDWEFLPQAGKTFTDAGSRACSTTRPDVEPPVVSLTAPADGATVGGTVTLAATASDDRAVERVDFLVDGAVVGTDTAAPYSASWDSSSAAGSSVALTARARDTAGQVTTSPGRTVTVAASAPVGRETLPNGSFETDISGWYGYRAGLSPIDGGTHGARAAHVTYGGTGSSYSIVTSPRPVSPSPAGTAYAATASVRAWLGRRICLRVREWGSSGAIGGAERCVSGSGAWQTVPTVSYTAVGGSSIELYAYADSAQPGDAFDIDAVSLRANP